MNIPLPAAELIIRHLSDADLVCQRELYPLDVGLVLYQRRVARKTCAKWRRFVLRRKTERMSQQFQDEARNHDMGPIIQQMNTSPVFNRLLATEETVQVENMMAAYTDEKKINDIGSRLRAVLDSDPALAIAIDAAANGTGPLQDYFQAMLQSGSLMQLMEVVGEAMAPAPEEPAPDLK